MSGEVDPQQFNGELVGGCDIILGMEADGSLQQLLATVGSDT